MRVSTCVSIDNDCPITAYASAEQVLVKLGAVEDHFEIAFEDDSVDTLISAAISGREKMRAKQRLAEELEHTEPSTP
jgi:hypothetical protein